MNDAPVPKLKNVMTPFPYSVDAHAPIDEAVEFMRRHKIRHLPVRQEREAHERRIGP